MRRLLICSIALFALVGCDAYGNPLQSTSADSPAPSSVVSVAQEAPVPVTEAPVTVEPLAEGATAPVADAPIAPVAGTAVVSADCGVVTIDLSGYPAGSHFIFGVGQQPPYGGTFDGARTLQYPVGRFNLNSEGRYGWSLRINSNATVNGQSGIC